MKRIYDLSVAQRTGVIWLAYMAVLWAVFAVALLTHPQAWQGVLPTPGEAGWRFLFSILAANGFILLLIAGSNIFVRFGSITLGLLILFIKAVQIGWLAGSNGFTPPFASVGAANAAFLRVGLWETTAYALVCAATLTKSLYVADTFPARRWVETRRLKDLAFSRAEAIAALAGILCLVAAALAEAF